MKKTLAVLLCAIMACCMMVSVFADDTAGAITMNVSASATTLSRGDTLTVSVSLNDCSVKAASFGQNVFDSNVFEIVDAEWGDAMGAALMTDVQADFSAAVAAFAKETSVSGVVYTYTLKVKDDAAFGKTSVSATPIVKSKASGKEIPYDITISAVEVTIACTSHVEAAPEVVKEATCTEAGSQVIKCTECGETVRTEAIPAKGHTAGTPVVTKAPTCTEAGVKETKCTVCGAVISTEAVPANGHTFGDAVVTKAPTCTEAGTKTGTCTVCGQEATEEIPALGHDVAEWTVTAEATCTEAGSKTGTCDVCGEEITEEIPALGHDWVKGETVDPTETEDGYTNYTCSVCGETKKDDVVPALGKADDTKPADDNKPADGNKPNQVPAGGDSMIFVVIMLATIACASAAVIVVRRKKTSK